MPARRALLHIWTMMLMRDGSGARLGGHDQSRDAARWRTPTVVGRKRVLIVELL